MRCTSQTVLRAEQATPLQSQRPRRSASMISAIVAGFVALAVLSACGERAGDDLVMRCDSSSDGLVRLQLDDFAGHRWRLRMERTIGSAVAGDGPEFGFITDIARGSDGRLYVADPMTGGIIVLSEMGEHIGTIGRRGDGPGEFRAPSALEVLAGDTLVVVDSRLWRVSTFDEHGSLLETEQLVVLPSGPAAAFDVGPDGGVYHLSFQPWSRALSATAADLREVRRFPNDVVRWDENDAAWSTVKRVPGLEAYVDRGSIQTLPFGNGPVWTAVRGGLWYSDSDSLFLHRFSQEGRETCRVAIEIAPTTVSEGERSAFFEATDRDSKESRERARASRDGIPMPAVKPVVQRLTASENGMVWIRRYDKSYLGEPSDSSRWLVVDADGQARARVSMPPDFRLARIYPERAYGVSTDSLGVQRVAVYRIIKP